MTERKKLTSLTSPWGIADWPRLQEPDMYKVTDGIGNYTVKLRFDGTEEGFTAYAAAIEAEGQAAKSEVTPKHKKTAVYAPRVQREVNEAGEETGFWIISYKQRAAFKDAQTGKLRDLRPTLWDAKGHVLPSEVAIGGGSVIRIAGPLSPYFVDSSKTYGVSMRIKGVQVRELKNYTATATDLGFGPVDGYDSEKEAAGDPIPAGFFAGDGSDGDYGGGSPPIDGTYDED